MWIVLTWIEEEVVCGGNVVYDDASIFQDIDGNQVIRLVISDVNQSVLGDFFRPLDVPPESHVYGVPPPLLVGSYRSMPYLTGRAV